MKTEFGELTNKGWQYYVDWRFAWIPTYCQGTFVWLRRVYFTWPEKNGWLIYESFPEYMHGEPQQVGYSEYPYDPREREIEDAKQAKGQE